MTTLKAICSMILLTGSVLAQSEPVHKTKNIFTVQHGLDFTDMALRSADVYTTHRNMSAPCGCVYENDPIAPKTNNLVLQSLFLEGFGLAFIGTDKLTSRSPRRWIRVAGRTLLVLDIAVEAGTVIHNQTLKIPPISQ